MEPSSLVLSDSGSVFVTDSPSAPPKSSRTKSIIIGVTVLLMTATAVVTSAITTTVTLIITTTAIIGLVSAVVLNILLRQKSQQPVIPLPTEPVNAVPEEQHRTPLKTLLQRVLPRELKKDLLINSFEGHKQEFFSFFKKDFNPKNIEDFEKEKILEGRGVQAINEVLNGLIAMQKDEAPIEVENGILLIKPYFETNWLEQNWWRTCEVPKEIAERSMPEQREYQQRMLVSKLNRIKATYKNAMETLAVYKQINNQTDEQIDALLASRNLRADGAYTFG